MLVGPTGNQSSAPRHGPSRDFPNSEGKPYEARLSMVLVQPLNVRTALQESSSIHRLYSPRDFSRGLVQPRRVQSRHQSSCLGAKNSKPNCLQEHAIGD